MTKLLFLGLGHMSRGDVSIAADFARQLPTNGFDVRFVTIADVAPHLRSMGLDTAALSAGTPSQNKASLDHLVRDFRPDYLIAADAFTLDYSASWSGVSMATLRQRYPLPLVSFDQYDWIAADHIVDFYPDKRLQFPRLIEECDLIIRNCPMNRPAAREPGVIVNRMIGTGPPAPMKRTPNRRERPVVFVTNSKWESTNVTRSPEMQLLIRAMPRILHSHLAALGRPLRIVHVGPYPWSFPVAEQLEYEHLTSLPPAEFHRQLTESDVYITANAVSVTLTDAVLAGVPSLLLQSRRTVHIDRSDPGPLAWLAKAAPGLDSVHPFRVFPWGWYDFLRPVLTDNPYTGCFSTASVVDQDEVVRELTLLLDDAPTRERLRDSQEFFTDRLAELPPAAEAFAAVVMAG